MEENKEEEEEELLKKKEEKKYLAQVKEAYSVDENLSKNSKGNSEIRRTSQPIE